MKRESYKQKLKLTIADLFVSGVLRLSYWYYYDFEMVLGFCNFRQRRPPCRMTGWTADNELKHPQFSKIHQSHKIFRFSFERSLLTPSFCANKCEVAESIGEPMIDSATLDNDVLSAKWQDRRLKMNLRTPGFVKFINFPKNPDFLMNALCCPRHSERSKVAKTNCHSARSKAKSQNPKMKMAAGKGGPWKEKSVLTKKLWLL